MKGNFMFVQLVQHLVTTIIACFRTGRAAEHTRLGYPYSIFPQASPFLPQFNRYLMGVSTATHEYTSIQENDALHNSASFLFLPVMNHKDLKKMEQQKISRRYFNTLVSCLLFGIIAVQPALAAVKGPGSAWQYCRKITLASATPATDYQVKVTLTTAALGNPYNNIKSDGSDLRFYDINDNNCSYWIETNPFSILGTNIIWVKVPTNGSSAIFMYYGNAAATAVSDGAATFPFFDDFNGSSLDPSWATSLSNGSVSVAAGEATVSCTSSGGSVNSPMISRQYTTSSTSYLLETKHRETAYYRIRYYAAATSLGSSPLSSPSDYGYFASGAGASLSGQVYYGSFPGNSLSSNTNYLTQFRITDGSTYNWYTYTYTNYVSGGATITNGARTGTYNSNARYISIAATEITGTSTVVDWVRVRKWNANNTTPDITSSTISGQVINPSASITSQINAPCSGPATGSATVTATGGGTPYTYSWNTSPVQTTQTATNLAIGSYTVTVTEATIGISATATATIIQTPSPVSSVISQSNPVCFNTGTGQIVVGASGGSGTGYMYSVNNGVSYQASNTFSNLPAGSYPIRVKDSNGCESKQVQ